jgi:amino acid transporter
MRYTHGDIPRPFRVPFGAWLIPISGILLCILLLINTTGGTGIRFGAWMAIGHIIYFSYSFWHSKGHLDRRQGSFASVNVSVLPETPITSHTQKSDAGSETIESTRL